jgi:hypothetical protein
MKITIKIFTLIFATTLLITSCTNGIEYEKVPESIQNEVGLKGDKLVGVVARELFKGNVYQVAWDKYIDIILENRVGDKYHAGSTFENTTTQSISIMGKMVAPGESMFVKNTMEAKYEQGAPEDSVYVVHVFADAKAIYTTPNAGHLFDESTFSAAPVKPTFLNPKDGKFQKAVLPTDIKRLIVNLFLNDEIACYVLPVDGAPVLGKPADYSKPHRYIVENENDRQEKGRRRRLYEVRVLVL